MWADSREEGSRKQAKRASDLAPGIEREKVRGQVNASLVSTSWVQGFFRVKLLLLALWVWDV